MNSSLLELIQGADVEWKPLGEIAELKRGNGLQKKDFVEIGKPVIHYGQIYTHYGNFADSVISYVKSELFDKLVKAEKGDVIITNTSENYEDVGTAVGWLGDYEIATGGHATVISPNREILDGKYLVYLTKTNDFQKEKRKLAKGTKVIDVSATDMSKIKIPIPSLEIQQKVVEILDKMTDYVTELTLRQKQYSYYRDQLLTFPSQSDSDESLMVRWTTLGEIGENLDSKRKPITKNNREAGEYPYYGASGIVDYVKDYIFDGDYLLISEDGANLLARSTPIAFSASGRMWVNNHVHVVKFDNYATRKFVEYYFSKIDISKYISTAAQPKLTQENLNKIEIPLPSLKLQSKIVEILDKFQALTENVSGLLPEEITLRQKQYAYYREQLLNFKHIKKEKGKLNDKKIRN